MIERSMMFGIQIMGTGKGRKRILSISLFAAMSVLATVLVVWAGSGLTKKIISERQAKLIEDLRTNVADSPAFLVERLFKLQQDRIRLFVPGMTKPLSFPVGLFSFDPKTFPDSFLKGLVYEPEHGSPVYHLKLREVRATREIEVLDANGKVFYVFKPRADYDPHWLARLIQPGIYQADCTPKKRASDEEWLDPSHVEMEIALIPDSYIEVYAEEKIASLMDVLLSAESETSSKASLSGGMTMMRSLQASSNIVFDVIEKTSTGTILVISYPDDFTNRLEIFVMSYLLDHSCSLLATNLLTAGTNTITWFDNSATCLLYTSPSPRDRQKSRMPSSA